MEQKVRKKRKLGSFPFLSVTFSTTLALLVIGLFGIILLQANRLTNIIKENVEIQVFLNKPISGTEIDKISRTIGSKPYILKNEEKSGVKLITREEAAAQFIADTGENFQEFLGDNPLRDLLIVNINPDYQSSDSLRMIKTQIEKIGGVYEVSYVESLVESINKNLTKISVILLGFFLILLTVVVVLINNTIKLALFSQRFLIRSMQLVGATSGFIQRPFLKRAVLYGFLAGAIGSAILLVLLFYANEQIEQLRELQNVQSLAILFGLLILLGIVVGYLSTYRAIRKYLKMSLDELY